MNLSKEDLKPAVKLEDVYKSLSPEPLRTQEGFKLFYREKVNEVRGGDKVSRLRFGLNSSYRGNPFKALLTGHPGVGKSTELWRLKQEMNDRFNTIIFSATDELDPTSFKPFDVLLLMLSKIAEETAKPVSEGGAGKPPKDGLLQRIWVYFSEEKNIKIESYLTATELEGGIGVKGDSLWAKTLGLFANMKGKIRYASDRKKEIVDYRLQRISTLIDLTNAFVDECNRLLLEATGKEWLIVGDDFEKPRIPTEQIETFFIKYANVLDNLRSHLIFTIPIALVYSEKATQLPFRTDQIYCVPDTPVFDRDHKSHSEGREAIRSILEARIDLSLFDKGQLDRLIVASGGNLRDLFSLVSDACVNAVLKQEDNKKKDRKVEKDDVTSSINNLRRDYLRRLGESPYDPIRVTAQDKIDRLYEIYKSNPKAKVTDHISHSLLRARAIQEFNGEGWFGVHPLVVDILAEQGVINNNKSGRVPGGTI